MKQMEFPQGIISASDGSFVPDVRVQDLFLEVLMEEQARLQSRLGLVDFGPLLQKLTPTDVTVAYNLLALIVEAVEVLQEINWKPWKWRKPRVVNRAALLSELVDITQFWANIVNTIGFTPEEIKAAYREKLVINYQRAAAQEQPDLPGIKDGDHADHSRGS